MGKRIAILATGDMGHAVGRALGAHGHEQITCLAGRSARSRGLAEAGGFRDVADLEGLIGEADMVLSILPPAAAVGLARDVARAMRAVDSYPVYVDCNAISPATVRDVAEIVAEAGAPVIDAGIIGLAPGKGGVGGPRFYVSGPDTGPMEALDGCGFRVFPIGGEIGKASGLKMCYAGLTKGTWSLHTAVLLAAEQMGLSAELRGEFEISQQPTLAIMEARVPRLPADAGRWIGEMEEIAASFRDVGVPSGFHDGAAEIFRLLAQTPFAEETRETMDMDRGLDQAIPVYADYLKRRDG